MHNGICKIINLVSLAPKELVPKTACLLKCRSKDVSACTLSGPDHLYRVNECVTRLFFLVAFERSWCHFILEVWCTRSELTMVCMAWGHIVVLAHLFHEFGWISVDLACHCLDGLLRLLQLFLAFPDHMPGHNQWHFGRSTDLTLYLLKKKRA